MFSQIDAHIKRRIAVGKYIFLALLLAACDQSLVACPQNIAQTASEFVSLFSTGKLSVDTANKLMGSGNSVERHGAYWQIQSAKCSAEVVLRADTQTETVGDAELRLTLASGLLLRDLEKTWGAGQLIFASKTSAVSFRVVGSGSKPTVVFASLFTPKPLPDSPVLSLQLRREGQ